MAAILASLASVFRDFNELLRCVNLGPTEQTPALRASLTIMQRLAREI